MRDSLLWGASDERGFAKVLAQLALDTGALASAVVFTAEGKPPVILSALGEPPFARLARAVISLSRWPEIESLPIGDSLLPAELRILEPRPAGALALITWQGQQGHASLESLAGRAARELAGWRAVRDRERVTSFTATMDCVTDALWLADAEGFVLTANRAAQQLAGPLDHVVELAERATDISGDALRRALVEEHAADVQLDVDGRRVDVRVRPILSPAGFLDAFVLSAHDRGRELAHRQALDGLVRVSCLTTHGRAAADVPHALVNEIRESFQLDAVALWVSSQPFDADGIVQTFPMEPLAEAGESTAPLRESEVFTSAMSSSEPVFLFDGEEITAGIGLRLRDGHRGVLVVSRSATAATRDVSVVTQGKGLQLLGRLATQAIELARSWTEVDDTRSMFLAALAAMPDAVLVADLNGRVRMTNDAAQAMIAEGDVLSSADELLAAIDLRDEAHKPVHALVQAAIAGRRRMVDGSVRERSEGTPTTETLRRSVTMHALPLADTTSGGALGALVVAHDVTRERELERMKDTFLSMAAHELRTPLTAMKTWAQFTLRQLDKNDDPTRVRRSLTNIERQTDKMAGMVDDLLDVSRLTLGRLTLRPGRIDLTELVRACAEEVARASPLHRFEVESDVSLPIDGDATRCEQVVTNLLTNAVKYSPDGGRITVRAFHDGAHACIEVSDQGMGIPADRLPLIFDRFYRAHDDAWLSSGGLGLGLWIAREIVQLHRGSISARSVLGEGSVFTVRLPLLPAE